MPKGDKSSYTDKQKRQAQHIEEGYESVGRPKLRLKDARGPRSTRKPVEAESQDQASATPTDKSPSKKGGRLGGAVAAARPATERSASAKKAARTRKRNAAD